MYRNCALRLYRVRATPGSAYQNINFDRDLRVQVRCRAIYLRVIEKV